ncbi:MAG: hypothetical protein CME88_03900 [Hirschia sp.]|nr:hypothetical protein [Hirschia sp.]MBF17501.1 hypothetical protein [Hirschia sp.]|tara:strand:+ start:136 stop:762 length:627 start_codon:yes stop_codon:yes gene_type:complete
MIAGAVAMLAIGTASAQMQAPRNLEMPVAQTAAQQGPMGPVSEFLPATGQDGVWESYNGPEGFGMRNRTDSDALRYFYASNDPADAGKRKISVQIRAVPEGKIGGEAGLLYGYDAATGNYFLLCINQDTLSLYRRDETGMNMMMSTSGSVRSGEFNTLTITEKGSYIDIALNGSSTGGIENDFTGKGAVGIAAWGTGQFEFTDFSIKR